MKCETILNDHNSNDPNKRRNWKREYDFALSLGHLIFEIVSDFEIRISDFGHAGTANQAFWAYTKA